MYRIPKAVTGFFVGWRRVATLGSFAVPYAYYWLKFRMTADEHHREAERLQLERPDDPEAQASATAHEQIAKFLEAAKSRRSEFWWLLFFAAVMFVFYALGYWGLI